jgi:hypothetical protein
MQTKHLKNTSQHQGQTLIETLVAAFMLIMGVSAAVGLAIYAFNSSTNITKQLIANGLAREGIEAIKNMRDTNWLQDTLVQNGCYDFAAGQPNHANCYFNWLGNPGGAVPFCLNPTSGNGPCTGDIVTYNNVLHFDSSYSFFWIKNRQSAVNGYGLSFDPTLSSGQGFYTTGANGLSCSDGASQNGLAISDYCRKIVLTKVTTAGTPFDPASSGGNSQTPGPLLKVQSQVWWVDKKCPRSSDWPGLGSCSVELDTYLTNWKTY